MALTKSDLQAIRGIVQDEVSGLKSDVSILKSDVKVLKKDAKKLRENDNMIIGFFEKRDLELRNRMEIIEAHLSLPRV